MELVEALGAEAETGNKSKGVPEPYSRTGSGGLESHCILGTANERRSPSLSCRCLILP